MPRMPRWRTSMPRLHRIEYEIQMSLRCMVKCHSSLLARPWEWIQGFYDYHRRRYAEACEMWKIMTGEDYNPDKPRYVDILGVGAGVKYDWDKILQPPTREEWLACQSSLTLDTEEKTQEQ